MENFESKKNGEWGLVLSEAEVVGSEEEARELLAGSKGEEFFPLSPAPRPSASFQYPIPKTQLLLYLIPIIGFFPSLWTLYRGQGSREQLAISRLSITLAVTWLLGYLLLATGAATSDFFSLRLFILNSFLTSGYFLVSVWLILGVMQGKSGRLPGFSTLAERVLGKYLS
jgi:hypothetical protein